jgi:uncharacterized membrane protein YuzA (DUF378 family)
MQSVRNAPMREGWREHRSRSCDSPIELETRLHCPGWTVIDSRLKGSAMKAINLVTLFLIIIGGLNWGSVGLFGVDLVAALFGAGSPLARVVYILVGGSALWQLYPLARATRSSEVYAQEGR